MKGPELNLALTIIFAFYYCIAFIKNTTLNVIINISNNYYQLAIIINDTS